jgi:hypothetical protein
MHKLRSVTLCAAFLVGVTFSTAQAQFEPLAFAVCKKISTDAERLKCFDSIGPKAKTAEEEVSNPTPIKGKWVYTESKSPIDDSDQLIAVLLGEPGEALLVFRCLERKTEAAFIPSDFFIGTGA